ncbi:DUF2505 domain-containing protein [Actinosynnema mirum]|uniref:DUF2505 domain-containing protein n=1 Tax=Actinosynnema mirum (strain ATCC 29888 / DSM 43827 / JCM 3225 / NBRC 14064 / NCIMB 13271 / NRRL B-12336 / IMRU 3971 / 101) TaxID=446462 RepID=C6WPK8_ACTMD|nr:DUF2505 domain-containing protein [Actinosynnema mirum]ACU40559.1 hypothetical protein Amir_6762 [Actinosynnema mirum DSM 43827]
MARRIEHLTETTWPAADVYTALVDESYLRARLEVLGGSGAALLSHAVTATGVAYELRQGVSSADLPPIASKVLGGDLVITRAESWTEAGRTCTSRVDITGVPGELDGAMTVADKPGGGSTITLTGQVKVKIPLVGGKVEEMVVEQVAKLLDKETEFTSQWLARRG